MTDNVQEAWRSSKKSTEGGRFVWMLPSRLMCVVRVAEHIRWLGRRNDGP